VILTPTTNDSIALSELNILIAEQKNCTVDELYTFVKGAPDKSDEIKVEEKNLDASVQQNNEMKNTAALTDKDLAKSYRSQADAMYKEAARLRKQADELDPPQKKTVKSKETVDV
jgi:hypothetical protein